jgi:ATP-dependent Lhr-like helicase
MVEPIPGIEAAIPAWEGELIPVPFEVSQGVGRLRKEIAQKLDNKPEDFVVKNYPVTRTVAKKLVKSIKAQKPYSIPSEKEIFVETDADNVVLNSCLGSLVNDTIGRALSTLLIDQFGSVGLKTDPYRIMLKMPGIGWKEVVKQLQSLTPSMLETILHKSLPNTELFHWRFLHVAKRLGVISRNADFGKAYLKKVVEVYSNTPVFEEALNEILQDKLDIEKSIEVLEMIKKGDIKINVSKRAELSPLGSSGLEQRFEIVATQRPEKEIFQVFKKRLLETKVGLVCTQCGKWGTIEEAGRVKVLMCPKCFARTIAVTPKRYMLEAQEFVKKKLRGKQLDEQEAKWIEIMNSSADLVIHHGKDAVVALAGRGIGPKTASRVLSRMALGDDLLKEILRAERNFFKTRRFWK